jgi:nitrogen fixation NifU-like protein
VTYSDKVRELVAQLPNSGTLANATHEASAENPICGDRVTLFLRVENERVVECRFSAEGCPAALAGAAGLTEIVCGMTIRECATLQSENLLEHLGGLPAHKRHGADLAIDTLRSAIATK